MNKSNLYIGLFNYLFSYFGLLLMAYIRRSLDQASLTVIGCTVLIFMNITGLELMREYSRKNLKESTNEVVHEQGGDGNK